ncbi:MAG: SxtJ family membrane protein [Vicinamibacterales bacterium]
MADTAHTRLTPAAGRRFGVTVGGAFLAIAAITWWRDHPTATMILGAAGSALALAGLAIPTRLGPVERAWMALAHAISKVTTPIVMGIIYLLVIFPTGVLRRAFGGNPLVHAERTRSFWRERPAGARQSASMRRQF